MGTVVEDTSVISALPHFLILLLTGFDTFGVFVWTQSTYTLTQAHLDTACSPLCGQHVLSMNLHSHSLFPHVCLSICLAVSIFLSLAKNTHNCHALERDSE